MKTCIALLICLCTLAPALHAQDNTRNDSTLAIEFDVYPNPVRQIMPAYPDSAVRVELQGTVLLHILVTKEGKVKDAVVLKSDADIFNQPAIDAAMRWEFTPALKQEQPVEAWIVLPFKFRLKDAK